MLQKLTPIVRRTYGALDLGSSGVGLLFRLWVAKVFFTAGLIKVGNWDSTLFLFQNEYEVPLLPPDVAAYLGTANELVLPVFLAAGLATRPVALMLFVFNIVAVVSYPALWETGFQDHIYWGLMLLVPLFYGPGRLSIDHLIGKLFFTEKKGAMAWAR
jgi:putative oxidoreductase